MTFNVLTEPWIPVRRKDGTVIELGILEVLRRAPELSEIADALPNYEYGMYRLLFVFLMDAYQPKKALTLRRLLKEGTFSEEVIGDYVTRCNQDGERFDLFDEEHPFLQCGRSEWEDDKNLKPVANLNPVLPSGNNHVHFDHRFENQTEMSFSEAAKALCAVNLFYGNGGSGYHPTISSSLGYIPIYTLIKGDNLFQTLIFGMIPQIIYNLPYSKIPPYWRTSREEIGHMPATVPLLFGLTCPCRFIRLRPSDGKVSEIDFKPGLEIPKDINWRDPYVAYQYEKNTYQSIASNISEEYWLNLASMIQWNESEAEGEPCAPTVLKVYRNLAEDDARMVLYATCNKQASYYDMQRGEYRIPYSILTDGDRCKAFQKCLKEIQKTKGLLEERLIQIQDIKQNISGKKREANEKREKSIYAAERKRTIGRYYFRCKQSFFEDLCPKLADEPESQLITLQDSWKKRLLRICWSEYDTYTARLGDDSQLLLAAQQVKANMFRKEKKNGESK